MPFKIIQTTERGKAILCVVPSLWEAKGVLWWPPKKMPYKKIIKDELSKPNKKEWRLMSCILKRDNIRTYELAEAELAIMETNSDTDVNDNEPRVAVVQNKDDSKFELLANKLTCMQETGENSCIDDKTTTENTTNNENVVQIFTAENILNIDQILANQKMISEKIDNMLQIQAITLENQQKIAQKLATQSVQLDEVFVQLAALKDGQSVTMLKDVNPEETESFTIKPIENQRDLISLDQLLADRENKNKLQKNLKFLCSASKGEGKTCAYKLQDILFTREFLCNCSWSGGSRGERSKIALKDYKNVLRFFHSLIQHWDPTFTVQDTEQFFKIITRNSNQRKSMKNLRTPSKRNRKNKIKDVQQKSENERQTNDGEKETEERESIQIQENAPPNDKSKDSEEESMLIQDDAPPNDESKKSKDSEEESMLIQDNAPPNDEPTEEESMQIEEQEKNDENILVSEDDSSNGLC